MMTTDLSSLKQTMCVDMVVGPNTETIPDPSVVPQESQSCHIPDEENCLGLPYQDHNYGARLPSKYPVSPISVFVKHSLNNGIPLNDGVALTNNTCLKPNLSLSPPVRRNGEIKTSVSQKNSLYKDNFSETMAIGEVTRCICGFSHDDGYMICCDRCSVWQHIDCVNIDRNKIPKTYLCDRCNPRELNKLEAMQLQAKKLNDYSIVSELSSGAESGDDRDPSKITYRSVQSTPTSLTITSNRTAKRSDSIGTGKKRKRSKDDNKRTTKKTNSLERKRSRSVSKGSLHEDESVENFNWAKKLKEWNESYREIDENVYTSELLQAVLSSSRKCDDNKKDNVLVQLQNQLAKVHQLRSKVLALEDISISQPVLEIMGSFMLSNQAEITKAALIKRPYPHMFFYNGFDGLEVVVDCRTVGNTARYLRRSCCPNSEIRHVVNGNQLHLLVFAKDAILSGSEITIPFDFKYQNCLYTTDCACGKFKECPVYKFTNMRINNHNLKQSKSGGESGRVSPLRLSISRIHDQINGYPNSDHESPTATDPEHTNSQPETQRKKSREDRKVEAYMRAFARLEKEKKRKEQLHQSMSSPNESKNSSKDNNLGGVAVSTIAKVSSPDAVSTDEIPASSVQPAKRTTRRRSTKGGRRANKKVRAPSFEAVLSPSMSIENDSNHSLDIAPITPDVLSMSSITEESNQTLILKTFSESAATSDIEMTQQHIEDTLETRSSSAVESVSTALHLSPLRTCTASLQSELSSVIKTSKKDLLSQVDIGLIPVESIDELPPLTIEPVSQEQPPIVKNTSSSSSSSKVTKKKTTTIEASSGNNKLPESTLSSSPSCLPNFTDWKFCPGVPNGKVHIAVGVFPRRIRQKNTYIKKTWLNSAKEEGLIPEHVVLLNSERTDTKYKPVNFKKRLLHTYVKINNLTTSNENEEKTRNVSANSPPELTTPKSQAQNHPNHCLATASGITTFQSTLSSSGAAASPTALPYLPPSRSYPAIEYEKKMQCNEESYFNPLHLNGNLHSPLPNSFERDTTPKQPSLIIEDVQPGSKKKVSLQEYLKRNKEQRKNLTSEQTESKTTKPNFTTISSSAVVTAPSSQPSSNNKTATTITSLSSTPNSGTEPNSLNSSQATTPTASVPESIKETKEKVHQESTITKPKESADTPEEPKSSKNENPPIDLNALVSLLQNNSLPDDVKEIIKNLSIPSADSSPKETTSNKSSSTGKTLNNVNKGPSKSLSVDRNEVHIKGSGTLSSIRPSVERSNSSPSIRQFPQTRQGGTPSSNHSRKVRGSQHNSPSSRHSTPSSTAPRKEFTSPSQSASPRLIRGQSGSSVSSQSPTPTIYDRRHRTDYGSRDSTGSAKSRHNSGASVDSKSPKSISSGESSRSSSKYSGSRILEQSSRSQESPQKVPSITPDVPGQPIPSLARGPGTARVPQVVYNRRSSPPHLDERSSWDIPPHELHHPSRSLKDVPYSRQDPYYYPPRQPSPPVAAPGDRSSRDKLYDRYGPPPPIPRPLHREDDRHSYYYHPSYLPPDYRGDRTVYYPVREARPPSPVPPPRHGSEYHPRSGYPPPHEFRR